MSARIVLNFSNGLAECAIERGHDGGSWLSLWQGAEVVLVKLSMPSLGALHLVLAQHVGAAAERSATAEPGLASGAQEVEPRGAPPGPAPCPPPGSARSRQPRRSS